jgi:DNA primase large subunit
LSIKLGTGDLAKYPFLRQASEYIRETHFDLEDFNRPEMKYIVDRAAERLEKEIAEGAVYHVLEKYEIEILTFLVMLILTKSIGTEPILRKHSLFEAMRAERFLVEDLKKEKNQEKKRLLLFKIFAELFKVSVDVDSSKNINIYKVKVADYLTRASSFHEEEWKLINRLVYKGYVYLDADETVRLIRSELSSLIYSRVKAMELPPLPEIIKRKVYELNQKLISHSEYHINKISDYPPCIKHALDAMNRGENLPHSARLLLATYMLTIGKNVDYIVTLFRNAPDYNEKVTKYQVEHLAGNRGSKTKYSVPSCQKLQNENLCFAIDKCNGIKNPIQFGASRLITFDK